MTYLRCSDDEGSSARGNKRQAKKDAKEENKRAAEKSGLIRPKMINEQD
jgi:hypothetical protein